MESKRKRSFDLEEKLRIIEAAKNRSNHCGNTSSWMPVKNSVQEGITEHAPNKPWWNDFEF